ncbi:hypothetical protein [Nitrosomonas sp.]|uniref:hypothetical protein n=1 Tax=Nitrosomonas sp. TaxID=42353 RepID=UPI001D6522EB|nr:hypothetical protein [Nitrosomonas sp.]MCB1947459.1 hypothetical protein [Nitrosomonas sp.]
MQLHTIAARHLIYPAVIIPVAGIVLVIPINGLAVFICISPASHHVFTRSA